MRSEHHWCHCSYRTDTSAFTQRVLRCSNCLLCSVGLATRQAVVLMGTVQLLDSLLLEEAARKLARRETPEVRQGEEEEDLSSVA